MGSKQSEQEPSVQQLPNTEPDVKELPKEEPPVQEPPMQQLPKTEEPTAEQLPKTEDGVPIALLDLSKVTDFQEWLVLVLDIKNDNKDHHRQLQRVHESTLSFYLILKSMGLKDDGSTTSKLIPKVTEFIQALEESSMPELETLVTWQGLSVEWLIQDFFQHPYLLEVRKFGCEAWHFRKWGVIVMIQWYQCKEMGFMEWWLSLSGPFVGHLSSVRHMWESTTTTGEMNQECCGVDATKFISYTGTYTVEHLVEALGQLSPTEFIWLDIFCVDQFAWTGKSRFPQMKKFKETFVNDLQHQIDKIGYTALILQRWEGIMDTLKKMWVLWEIFNTANGKAKLSVLLSTEQINDFVQNCLLSNTKFDEIQKSLSKIDVSLADADDDGDRDAIFKQMSEQGLDQVNKRVSEVIRQWQIRIGENALEMQKGQKPSMTLLNHLGLLYEMQGSYKKAHCLCNKAVGLAKELGENHPDTLASLNNLAAVLYSQGQYQQAATLYQQLCHQRQQVFGENHPDTLASLNNLAAVLHSQGQS